MTGPPDPWRDHVRTALERAGGDGTGVVASCRIITSQGSVEGLAVTRDDATLGVIQGARRFFAATEPIEVPYADVIGIDRRRPRYLNRFLLAAATTLVTMVATGALAPHPELTRTEGFLLGVVPGSMLGAMAIFVWQHGPWFVEWRAAYRRADADPQLHGSDHRMAGR